jgi:hypothetical protein
MNSKERQLAMGLAKPLIMRLDKTALDPEKDQIRMVTVKYELPRFSMDDIWDYYLWFKLSGKLISNATVTDVLETGGTRTQGSRCHRSLSL